MIDHVVGSEYLNVTSNKGAQPYINTSNPITGMMAFDSSSQSMKVYDGNGWQILGGGSASINLTPNAINILKWAEKKMFEEALRNKLAEANPTIRDLMDQIKQKEEQLSIVLSLIKEEVKV